KKDGDACVAGISDYAQDQLGDVVYVDLPEPGTHFAAGEEFGSVESVKSVSPLHMPVSGEVLAVNSALEDNPGLLNADCYGQGWIVRIKQDDESEPGRLLDDVSYRNSLT
ncbi:MAG: glycine cleavage system protein GcvH, partial [Desulfovibrio sp.]|nr:glycine cleavage system protein GcvH [Desulfovibrio sp.]